MRKLLFVVILCACGVRQSAYVEGGLYSVASEDGKFNIVKILRIEEQGVHLRLYSNTFAQRPTSVDEATLYMAGMDHKPDETLGMGHAPISRKAFANWRARLIKVVPVREDELDGYKMWLEAKGGFFE